MEQAMPVAEDDGGFVSSLASREVCVMEKMEDGRLRTIHCLRGRLLAERVASKAAKEEAETLARRLEELERKLQEEIKCMNRAEKKLKHAMKKLESLKPLDGGGQMDIPVSSVSSTSSQSFLGQQRLEGDTAHCGLPSDAKTMPSSLGSEDLPGDELDHRLVSLQGSWTMKPQHQEELNIVEADEGFSPKECTPFALSDGRQEDNMLALVPVSKQPDMMEVGEPEMKNTVQCVLLALRHVKEQLLQALGRRADMYSSTEFFG
ncbi:hypothetical protein MUK42_05187 [Musa troglodytarum]|uniref:Uncharacterized protein n=1 Tax=Musa troglodytarum TaxID=320322 RepID=A0A9E7ENG2_9LILI|nr:hypothetical protein MUK42_05187 [Musa troglodytarum]